MIPTDGCPVVLAAVKDAADCHFAQIRAGGDWLALVILPHAVSNNAQPT
jgi:hypothetical protein